MPNIMDRIRGGMILEKAERGLPTVTPSTDSDSTSPTVDFLVQARTHEFGDTIGNGTRRTALYYYVASSGTDFPVIASASITGATLGATGIAVIPDSTVLFHHGHLICSTTGACRVRFHSTSGVDIFLVVTNPDGFIVGSTGHSSSST